MDVKMDPTKKTALVPTINSDARVANALRSVIAAITIQIAKTRRMK
jgi:hypothetical protein